MEDQVICDECGCEFDAHESMPDPETNRGDYCFECFLEIEYKWDVKRGIAFLQCELPSMDDFMKGYKKFAKGSLDPKAMENNCHAAANALVQLVKDKLDIKLQRGHWIGIDARHNSRTVQQHSWTKVRIPDNNVEFIVDPTQWVFTGANPSLCIVDSDDERYDVGGYAMKKAICEKKEFPERKGNLFKTKFSDSTKKWLSSQSDRDWSAWSTDEIFILANMDPREMGGHQKEIFKAIAGQGHKGFIPLEGWALAMGEM